jgi:hypothetical protein
LSKPVVCNQLIKGRITLPLKNPRIGVPPDEEQLIDEYRQTKAVVIHRSDDAGKMLTLQLGRDVVGKPNLAKESLPVCEHLKRVAINEVYKCPGRHYRVSELDVTNYATCLVDLIERRSEVRGGTHLETPACSGKVVQPLDWMV